MIRRIDTFKIQCEQGNIVAGVITLSGYYPNCMLGFVSEIDNFEFNAYDFFECLIDFRIELAKKNCFPLCNGARRDVSCGGMLREATEGCWGYIMRDGKAVQDEDEVDIFAYAEANLIVSVHEQIMFYESWNDSMR